MIRVLFLLGLISCSKIPEVKNDIKIPDSAYTTTYQPIVPTFGYNPDNARRLYKNPNLEFVNLDPAQYPDALGHIVTSTTLSMPIPAQIMYGVRVLNQGSLATRAEKYGMVPSPFDYQNQANIDGLDMAFTLSDALGKANLNDRVYSNINCFTCHAGVYGNKVIGGAPNNMVAYHSGRFVDLFSGLDADLITAFPPEVFSYGLRLYTAFTELDITTTDLTDIDLQILYSTIQIVNMTSQGIVSGYLPYPAQNLQYYFLMVASYLKDNGISYEDWDYTNNKYRQTLTEKIKQYKQLPVGGPKAWWQHRYINYRGVFNYTPADIIKTSIDFTIFFRFPGFHSPLEEKWEESYHKMHDIVAYMDQIESPEYPTEIDYSRISEGRQLYAVNCSSCHGVLQMDSPTEYTLIYDQAKGLQEFSQVGTSSDYIKAFIEIEQIIAPIIESYRTHPHFPTTIQNITLPTISAQPLVGSWATAPFFHNQSVPTMYHVLNSRARPKVWRLSEDRYAYDYENMGVQFSIPTEYDISDRYVYDTTVIGAGTSNQGHTYGDHLSDKERYSLIEFLKTLTTKNVKPHPIGGLQ